MIKCDKLFFLALVYSNKNVVVVVENWKFQPPLIPILLPPFVSLSLYMPINWNNWEFENKKFSQLNKCMEIWVNRTFFFNLIWYKINNNDDDGNYQSIIINIVVDKHWKFSWNFFSFFLKCISIIFKCSSSSLFLNRISKNKKLNFLNDIPSITHTHTHKHPKYTWERERNVTLGL